jgi:catechol 2,3-dioxygenase-like lactoylglutathione lyase family enzyme
MTIDHIGVTVSDYEASKAFFTSALAPLSISLVTETHGWAGFGKDGKPEFWVGQGATAHAPMHIAFLAATREQVRAFYKAALAAGGKDNGGPGIRAHYHPHYFGAFVIGPNGHNIEAVCHVPAA